VSICEGIIKRTRVSVPAILGLDLKPPGLNQWNRFFYRSPLISQQLALLNNIVGSTRSPVILVMGERGSGKTTLMNRFITEAGFRWRAGRIKFRTNRKLPATWRNLGNRMVLLTKPNHPPSVIIDDAHELSLSELNLVLKYAVHTEGRRRFQSIVLLAEPSIREHLAPMMRRLPPKSVVEKIHMTPLTEKQTAAYLKHRLRAAGYLRRNPFSQTHIRKIYERSSGLPGWINGEAYLLLKSISRHRNGFRKSVLMGFVRWGMEFRHRVKEGFTALWHIKFYTFKRAAPSPGTWQCKR
jgi:AAA+ ATPase superfamily predicted ATPase